MGLDGQPHATAAYPETKEHLCVFDRFWWAAGSRQGVVAEIQVQRLLEPQLQLCISCTITLFPNEIQQSVSEKQF
jgi:hypothetical protein